ncbi:MAG: SGNH/GDSL hydrolase family protein [Acidobacteriota bacterium]|nr:SGNH/GDSL hydrolase family protein [Acidobacteriota bacterium]
MLKTFKTCRAVAAGAALAAGLTAIPVATGVAAAAPLNGDDRNGTYLALGDSVAFGYQPPNATPAPDYSHPRNFVSYANYVARDLGERVTNASCPGETTTSMLDVTAISNGCENTLGAAGGYRTAYPLHVQYSGSQMAYAVRYLTHHSEDTSLVTIDIGANDGFVCEELGQCSTLAGLQAALQQISAHLHDILGQIRGTGYRGPLVLLNYYSTAPYKDPTQASAVALTVLLNQALDAATTGYNVIIADGFGAFAAAASGTVTDDPCAAGLLIKVSSTPLECNIHPSQLGHQVLAASIENALAKAGDQEAGKGTPGGQRHRGE